MFKSTLRITAGSTFCRALPKHQAARRSVSTAPPHQKSRSWRNSAARWGIAGALMYYYNTANAFAEEPAYAVHAPPETSREPETLATVETVAEERRARSKMEASPEARQDRQNVAAAAAPYADPAASGSPEALEEEAQQQGAFNEETGEINWDCPCLGGMAYGPCGEPFRAAFSCFVFSKEEPKGVDCIENFKNMQNCFRDHPDVYGSELEDDDDAPAEEQQDAVYVEASKSTDEGATKSAESHGERGRRDDATHQQAVDSTPPPPSTVESKQASPSQGELKQNTNAEEAEESLVPKSWHDSR